jgi:ribosomal protein L14
MAGIGTKLVVSDNSGLEKVKCIRIHRTPYKGTIINGDYVIVSVSKGHLKKKFSNKKTCLGLVIMRKKRTKRLAGYYIEFSQNRVILFATTEKTIGTRIYGPISGEAKQANETKLIKLAKKTV